MDSSVDGQVIDSGMLARRIQTPRAPASEPRPAAAGSLALDSRLKELESGLIREALRQSQGNQAAARLLEISRNGLANKLKRLDICSRRIMEAVRG